MIRSARVLSFRPASIGLGCRSQNRVNAANGMRSRSLGHSTCSLLFPQPEFLLKFANPRFNLCLDAIAKRPAEVEVFLVVG